MEKENSDYNSGEEAIYWICQVSGAAIAATALSMAFLYAVNPNPKPYIPENSKADCIDLLKDHRPNRVRSFDIK